MTESNTAPYEPEGERPDDGLVAALTHHYAHRRTSPLHHTDPEELGSYRLLRRLPNGGSETDLFVALDDAEERLVVIKLLRSDADTKAAGRFLREGRNAIKVNSPYVARTYEVHETSRHYIVQQFAPGVPLNEVLDQLRFRGERMSNDDLYRLQHGVYSAVRDIARARIVHCDVKPGNIVLGPQGPMVVDFGGSFAVREGYSQIVGTPGYYSPQQLHAIVHNDSRGKITSVTDVYAAALVLYAAATNGGDPLRRPKEEAPGNEERLRRMWSVQGQGGVRRASGYQLDLAALSRPRYFLVPLKAILEGSVTSGERALSLTAREAETEGEVLQYAEEDALVPLSRTIALPRNAPPPTNADPRTRYTAWLRHTEAQYALLGREGLAPVAAMVAVALVLAALSGLLLAALIEVVI